MIEIEAEGEMAVLKNVSRHEGESKKANMDEDRQLHGAAIDDVRERGHTRSIRGRYAGNPRWTSCGGGS